MGKNKKKSKASKTVTVDEMPAIDVPGPKRTTSSPFYAAISAIPFEPSKEPKPLVEEMEPPPQPSVKKASRRGKEAASWAIKVAVVAIPAAISGFFTYQSSKSEAEAGYKTLVTAVKELQEATKEVAERQSYMQGQLDVLHRYTKTPRPATTVPFRPKVLLSTLPTNLGAAVQRQDKPMEQKVVSFDPPVATFAIEERAVMAEAANSRSTALADMKKSRSAKAAAKKKAIQEEAAMVIPSAPPEVLHKVEESHATQAEDPLPTVIDVPTP